MKKTLALIGLFLILGFSLQAGGVKKNDSWVGFQLTAIRHAAYAGVNFEHGIGSNLALGLEVNVWLGGVTGMVISPHVIYHFPMRSSRIDLFVGAGPAMAFGFKIGGTDFRLKAHGGARYWITPRTAVYVKLVSEFGEKVLVSDTSDTGSLGGAIGVNLRF